ncbi:uncharacterized protein LOC121853346 [Homarus americanus]|uniref:Putative DM4/DM12 family-like protein 6 n=1 Tax=Homarus americanus TaxID=6706 RepID=A0A8J5JGH3_HOMAM|nr:uncharacterized protein LOC121853346 [Homarus americanus]XP_042203350.1 uncharacterized protein LOC121853346 [Homarus americanus]KAG7156796.1 putative DM4/DM12 family-like protein 6 [Homarus americanus]
MGTPGAAIITDTFTGSLFPGFTTGAATGTGSAILSGTLLSGAGLGVLAAAGVIGIVMAAQVTQTFRSGRRLGSNKRKALDEQRYLNSLLERVLAQDRTSCGKKLMCELEAQPEDTLLEVSRNILNLVGSVAKPGEGLLPPGAAGEYLEAKNHGHLGLDCSQEYPACPYDGQHLRNLMMTFLP